MKPSSTAPIAIALLVAGPLACSGPASPESPPKIAGAAPVRTPGTTPALHAAESVVTRVADGDKASVTPEAAGTARSAPALVLAEQRCGGATLRIKAQEDGAARSVEVVDASGRGHAVAGPPEMAAYAPVGVACAAAPGTAPAFVVQYGEASQGCSICEWNFLVDAQGRLLTRSEPAMLSDPTRPAGQREYPNNIEYTTAVRDRRLQVGDMTFIPSPLPRQGAP